MKHISPAKTTQLQRELLYKGGKIAQQFKKGKDRFALIEIEPDE